MCKHDCGVALYPPPEVGGFTATEDKMPERDFGIYHDWLTANNKNLPIFPVDMRKREDVLLLVDTIIASLELTAQWAHDWITVYGLR